MSIEDKIPSMSVSDLENLQDNALRISKGGASKQQAEAQRLLPIIADALAAQRKVRNAEIAEKKVVRQKEMAEARAKKTALRKAAKNAETDAAE